jgi:hypothetical protein
LKKFWKVTLMNSGLRCILAAFLVAVEIRTV